ncbi:MAG: NAD(P)-dependent oxidoreductase [Verrucomicrobiota bacterium]|nr:NAD(P)-dependent oxidoreductase [Verrucomicrobiota bacterium]
MRCLITGASGWVGHAFATEWARRHGMESVQLLLPPLPLHALEARRAEALEKNGFRIIHHDLLDPSLPIDDIREFDILVHCAAYTHTEKSDEAVRVNDRGTRHLIEALGERLKGRRVLYFGSCASFDCFAPPPGGIAEGQSCNPLTIYGQTKLWGESILQELADRFGYAWTVLRLPTVYGPGYRPGGLFDIIKKGIEGFHPITRIGWPGSLSLLFIDDLTALLVRICEERAGENTTLHLADPNPVRFTKLIGARRVRLPVPGFLRGPILFFVRRFHQPHALFISAWRLCHLLGDSMVLDTAKAQRLLPMEYTDLEEGLRKTFAEPK